MGKEALDSTSCKDTEQQGTDIKKATTATIASGEETANYLPMSRGPAYFKGTFSEGLSLPNMQN